jgi:serine/threonine-protein kinase
LIAKEKIVIGQFIQHYRLEQQLGISQTATLYRARDPEADLPVAIKVFTSQPSFDDHFLAHFEQEIEQVRSFDHSQVVPILSYGVRNRQPFFVTRYLPGGSLENRLGRSPVTLQEICRMISDLAEPLDEAHRQGLIHRNLKPSNILFNAEGKIYLADFGLTQMTDAAALLAGTKVFGTPEYMSPEQIVDRQALDGRSDIYALGVILFRALTGHLPYEGDSAIAVMLAHLSRDIPRPSAEGIPLPHGCEAVIFKAMAKERDVRFMTAREFADVLEIVVKGGAGSVSSPFQFPTQVMIKS